MKVPITFEHKGKQYAGFFTQPHGAGGNVWFLTVNNYHRGQLIFTQNYGWRFYSNSGDFNHMGDFFGDYITAYLQ